MHRVHMFHRWFYMAPGSGFDIESTCCLSQDVRENAARRPGQQLRGCAHQLPEVLRTGLSILGVPVAPGLGGIVKKVCKPNGTLIYDVTACAWIHQSLHPTSADVQHDS